MSCGQLVIIFGAGLKQAQKPILTLKLSKTLHQPHLIRPSASLPRLTSFPCCSAPLPFQIMEEESLQSLLRRQSLQRITIYTHPQIALKHEPINAKECEELQAQLRERTREKVELVRREGLPKEDGSYEQVYGEFVKMTLNNESQQAALCRDLQDMHEMADMLMNPPAFGNDLFLSTKEPPSSSEQQQLGQIYAHYEQLYKSGHQTEEDQAADAIRRGRDWVLSHPGGVGQGQS